MTWLLKKEKFGAFIERLQKKYEVIAPVKDDIVRFQTIESADDITFDYVNTTYPPKKIFLPDHEKLFDYSSDTIKAPGAIPRKVLFGVRACDIAGLLVLDRLLLSDPVDNYYAERRKNTLIIGLECLEPGENCFCDSMDIDRLGVGYDLLLREHNGDYIVKVGSGRGEKLLNKDLFTKTKIKPKKRAKCKDVIPKKQIRKIPSSLNHSVWKKNAEKCLSCGACTMTCPTCNCFIVREHHEFNLDTGYRLRIWGSCQVRDFTEVAGGYVFRREREKRLKWRIYHKISHFKKKFNAYMCVGCGRCITNCPTNINMVEMINKL